MRPVQIRRIELDAHPAARPAAVYTAALEHALRWQCDVRVLRRDSAFVITFLAAQQAAAALAETTIEILAPGSGAAVDGPIQDSPARPA